MARKCPSATWPLFLSASLCHHSTYAGPPLWQLSFHQTWPSQIDEAWIPVTWSCWQESERMILAAANFRDLGCEAEPFCHPLHISSNRSQNSFSLSRVYPTTYIQHSEPSQMANHKQDVMSSSLWIRLTGKHRSVNSSAPLPSLYLSRWFLIRVEWLQYWPCGRGFRPCPQHRAHSDCWPLFAILY